MSKKLLFATIASILATAAFAETTTSTIPTQGYVDTNFQSKIPAGTTGSVVTYNGTSNGQTQFNEKAIYNSTWVRARANTLHDDKIPQLSTVKQAVEWLTAGANSGGLPTGQTMLIPAFNDDNTGQFGRMLVVNSLDDIPSGWASGRAVIPNVVTMNEQLATKQNKMTCMRWLDNAEETDENCLLWSIAD